MLAAPPVLFFFWGGPPGAVTTPGTPSPLPSPCPGLCQPVATSPLGSRSGFLFSFFPRSEQLIIYPVIKEETVNEMKTSQKHLLGRLSSPAPGRLRRKRWREGDGGCRGGHGGSRRLSPTPGLPHHGPLLLLLRCCWLRPGRRGEPAGTGSQGGTAGMGTGTGMGMGTGPVGAVGPLGRDWDQDRDRPLLLLLLPI